MKTCVEQLEGRIAPATLLPGGKGLTYLDVDGDLVRVKVSKGQLSENDFTFDTAFAESGPQQLQTIKFSDDGDEFAGAKLTISAKAQQGVGNGLVNVGYIDAKGVDLATVTVAGDLGRISVGDDEATKLGLKTLKVKSLGLFGTSTQAMGGNLRSFIYGGLGALLVAGDVKAAELNAVDADGQMEAGIGLVKIGGSLVGGANTFSGQIYSPGKIGSVSVGGDLVGGAAASTGQISAGTTIGSVFIGGEVRGGAFNALGALSASGAIISGRNPQSIGDIGSVTIGGSLLGGAGDYSGALVVGGAGTAALGSLKIGGEVMGNGDFSGTVKVAGALGTMKVGGSLLGGAGQYSGSIVGEKVTTAMIGGDVRGGAGDGSGRVQIAVVRSFTLGGSLLGGDVSTAGNIRFDSAQSVLIRGSIITGDGNNGVALSLSAAKAVVVQGSVVGGGTANQVAIAAESLQQLAIHGDVRSATEGGYHAKINVTGHVAKLSIGGSVRSGTLGAAYEQVVVGSAGAIAIQGEVAGTSASPVRIMVVGSEDPAVDLASFTVGGAMEYGILAGGMQNSDGVKFGSLSIGGDFVASRIAVSTKVGGDALYGTADDTFLNNGGLVGSIARVVIKGQAYGTPAAGDAFQIVAEQIAAVQVNGVKLKLLPGTVALGPTGDVAIRQAS